MSETLRLCDLIDITLDDVERALAEPAAGVAGA